MTGAARICVLGNSHLGAAKLGWDQIASAYPGVEAVFFGAPWDLMSDLVVDGDALVPGSERLRKKLVRTSGGLDRIVPSEFDRIVLYGLQFGPRRLLQLYRTCRTIACEWREPLENLAPMRRSIDPVHLISGRLFDAAAMSGLENARAVQLVHQIGQMAEVPMAIVAAPGFSEVVLETGDWDGPLGGGDIEWLAARYLKLAVETCPKHAELVLPPSHMTSHGLFTARRYAAGENAQGRADHVHTSSEYGAKTMQIAMAALGLEQPQAA